MQLCKHLGQHFCQSENMSVQKADGFDSGDITAEQDNVRNTESANINSVLRCFLHSQEETLEEMVGGFLYLTMDDLKNSMDPIPASNSKTIKHQTTFESDVQGKECRSLDPHLPSPETVSIVHLSSSQTKARDTAVKDEVAETLGADCTLAGDMLLRGRPPSLTKFDNFVQTEDQEEISEVHLDDELLRTLGYTRSCGMENTDGGVEREERASLANFLDHPGNTMKGLMCQPSSVLSLPSPSNLEESIEDETIEYEMLSSTELSHFAVMVDDAKATSRYQQPGEVEDNSLPPPVVPTLTVLETSTRVTLTAAAPEGAPHSRRDTECGDEVMPFALDPDFDYDTVPCTPKFTQAEMEYLASLL